MFSKTGPRETIDDCRAGMQAFHPRGFRAMAWASAEDVRDVLPHIDIPTSLVYGDRDVRAPLTVARDLRAAISGSRLVVLPDGGHVCNIEAPDEFNAAVRDFLRDTRRARPRRQLHRSTTRSTPSARDHLTAAGHAIRDEDIERLSPLGHEHITLTGRYRIALPDTLRDRAAYRPLKAPPPDAAAA